MSTETIADLRTALFATLRGLNDKDAPLDIERAKAVAEIGQVIINTAKVEIDFIRATGNPGGSGFIPLAIEKGGAKVVEQRPGVRVTRHKLGG